MKSKPQIEGSRLNGELSRDEQREIKQTLRAAYGVFFSLRDAVLEHSDGKKIMARAAELREKKARAYDLI